ncbi:MAG: SprT-like domain-containing protein [Sulfurimonadaceae bacterium]
MFKKRLEAFFVVVILVSLAVLGKNYYDSYTFKHSAIPQEYEQRITAKDQEVLRRMQQHYGYRVEFPLIITDKFKGRLYGLTTYTDGQIKIYLNKKVMRESIDYMVESVIAHEYAHALLFNQGHVDAGDGHSVLWQETCRNLGGKNCRQYVDSQEVVMRKLAF